MDIHAYDGPRALDIGHMVVAWVYGVGLTQDIKSYAWVLRAGTAWAQASRATESHSIYKGNDPVVVL